MDKLKNILGIIEEGMTFTTYVHQHGRSKLWKFIEFSGDDVVVENPEGEILSKPQDFLGGIILEIQYLDYTIVNSGNSDGWVITKKPSVLNDFKIENYECNLGNFTELEDAKEYCVRFFMIVRPETFAKTICNKTVRTGSGTCHEYFLLEDCILKEGIEIPSEVKASKDMNFMITFNGKSI